MSVYKTDKCFFTQIKVISNNESDGTWLDGYYYSFKYNETIREIRLDSTTVWKNNEWVKQYGSKFIELIEKYNKWSFFEEVPNIDKVKKQYSTLVKMDTH